MLNFAKVAIRKQYFCIFAANKTFKLMKTKLIAYIIIGVLGCIIVDAAFVAIAIHHEAPISEYILMGISLPIFNILYLALNLSCFLEEKENECLVHKLPKAVKNKKLPKLK